MEVNIIKEIKSLNNCLVKKMFIEKKSAPKDDFHPKPLQIEIISYLSDNQDKVIYQKDLEEHLNISKAAISEVLSSMENKGIITRVNDETDARKRRIIATEDTLKRHHIMLDKLKVLNTELLTGITDDELNTFIEVTNKLKNNMKKK